ncbi:MAG: hypothetical protein DRG78_00440 [Epsilonproteobacteria bacterium]|nr:MAG: hypothetical protein DRG78_00440 [Campylobacterota bacterium]
MNTKLISSLYKAIPYPGYVKDIWCESDNIEKLKNAIKLDSANIKLAKDQTEELQLLAVDKEVDDEWNDIVNAMFFITNPTEKVQIVAVTRWPNVIKTIKITSLNAQLIAVKSDPFLINYIDNPGYRLQAAAVRQDIGVMYWIKNPKPRIIRYVINYCIRTQNIKPLKFINLHKVDLPTLQRLKLLLL